MGEVAGAAPLPVVVAGPAPRGAARPRAFVLDAGGAQLVAWCVLALVNQPLIVARLPPAPAGTRLLHHALDAGGLVALGVLSLGAARLGQWGLSRLPGGRLRGWLSAALLGAAVFAVAMATLGEDLANVAARHEVRLSFVRGVASLALALAFAATLSLRRLSPAPLRLVWLFVGVAGAAGNAFLLVGDYPAVHLMVAGLAALLVGTAVEGRRLPGPGRLARRGGLGVLAVAGAAAVLVRPPGDVQRRLLGLPSSVVAPFASRLRPSRGGIAFEKVPRELRRSPWFRDRSRHPPVPSTRAFRPSGSPIVLLLTVEAMRADVLERGKYKPVLPELHRLRVASAYFTGARAATSATTTSLASVFTCRYYSSLRWSKLGDSRVTLTDDAPRFPELLAQAGVRTVHLATYGRLRAANGVGRGFQEERWIPEGPRRSVEVVDRLLADLDANLRGPYFAYAHFDDSHAPYDRAGKQGKPFDRYVREIGLFDAQLARLRRHLEERGLAERTVLVVAGDHGEAFGEHGTNFHARTVYDEELRVALLVHVPGQPPLETSLPVTLLDLGPTILDLFGVATPGACLGESLAPLVAGEPPRLTRPIGFDTGRRLQGLVFPDGMKTILDLRQGVAEVYDLKTDPEERENLAEGGAPRVEAALEATRLFFEVHRRQDAGYEAPWQQF